MINRSFSLNVYNNNKNNINNDKNNINIKCIFINRRIMRKAKTDRQTDRQSHRQVDGETER